MKTLLVLCACVAAASAQYVLYSGMASPWGYGWPVVMPVKAEAKKVAAEAVVKEEARKRRSIVLAGIGKAKAKVRVAKVDEAAKTPADTKLLKIKEEEVEVPVARFAHYGAHYSPIIHLFRKKRDLVTKVRMAMLGAVDAKTPADTKLLKRVETEHSVVMPMVWFV